MPFDMTQTFNPNPIDLSDAYTTGEEIVQRFPDELTGKTSTLTIAALHESSN